MKLHYNLIFLSFFLIAFTACQSELTTVVEPAQNEVLQINTNVADLVQRTVAKDGSKDNIIDNSSCIEVELPVTVIVNGLEVTVDSEADFDVIEAIFDEFDDDDDNLELLFPIEIILSDYSKITINNYDELQSIVDQCSGENEMDDDIECLDFVYPITISIYDSQDQLTQTINVESDEEFYNFMEEIGEDDVAVVNFPITVVLYDGTEKTINNMDELESTIEDVKDMCDEDDDNDYDDDDCVDCSTEQITALLMTCSWEIDKLVINDEEQTEQYSTYLFTFLENGVVKVVDNGQEIFGTWVIEESDFNILVKINFESLTDFSFNWILYEIEHDDEIDLRIDNNKLKLQKNCDDVSNELMDVLKEGDWLVANFINHLEDTTADYSNFILDFKMDNAVTATNGTDIIEGTWEVSSDGSKLELNFDDTVPFNEFNEDWLVVEFTDTRVEVNNLDSAGNEESKLVFERQ